MWHFGIWFSRHGGVGWMVGLDDLRGAASLCSLLSGYIDLARTV